MKATPIAPAGIVLVKDGPAQLVLMCGCWTCWRQLARVDTGHALRQDLLTWVRGRCPAGEPGRSVNTLRELVKL